MQVTDPVCGMQIESGKAAAAEKVQGQTYFFCSSSCHKQFQADPGRYVKKAPAEDKGGPERR